MLVLLQTGRWCMQVPARLGWVIFEFVCFRHIRASAPLNLFVQLRSLGSQEAKLLHWTLVLETPN